MKRILYTAFAALFLLTSCSDLLTETNVNPNEPTYVPTSSLLTNAQFRLVDDIRDEWYSGRMALTWIQYFAQTSYTQESRYQYRKNSNSSAWKLIYADLGDLQAIIDLNTNPKTKVQAASNGPNVSQIAVARVLKSWTFMLLTETYGPIPYHSVGVDNPNFQALQLKQGIVSPAFADSKEIYLDILKELRAAADDLAKNEGDKAFILGDQMFNGDATKWKRFANSLILRGATRISAVYPAESKDAMDKAIASGVMKSNADNAMFKGEKTTANASPFYQAFAGKNREDFAVANSFVDLLKGESGPFGTVDPRLYYYASPVGASALAATGLNICKGDYVPKASDKLGEGSFAPKNYIGMPYGIESKYANKIKDKSLPNMPILAEFSNPLMDYAEVCFLLSERDGWNKDQYEKGVRASMERWGVQIGAIDAYMKTLKPATEENVLTQKYIALYMQPHNAWAEYRRTGFPKTLLMPGDVTFVDKAGILNKKDDKTLGKEYKFTSLIDELTTTLPSRIGYSIDSPLLNKKEYQKALLLLEGKDNMATKLWWAKK
ncbi:SusD/RagB family nutrient-binding outer membrane lipoprotein [Halosquirtibacter xylanolyticus]|uniref:SusD/RagB family nutrient-binding outer membrane lipoprotein n=1 Tax=Halosquirtibacter xylanolyticus TaxID=3374599 RepID=UPI003749419A|nr:SusD/RagB family nutrient-binding outer membrane lipoprotein [Prolixibacteraceae bacterium]